MGRVSALNKETLTASQKVRMLRCAASFVTVAYAKYASFLMLRERIPETCPSRTTGRF